MKTSGIIFIALVILFMQGGSPGITAERLENTEITETTENTYCQSTAQSRYFRCISNVRFDHDHFANPSGSLLYADYTDMIIKIKPVVWVEVILDPYEYEHYPVLKYWRMWIDYNRDNAFDGSNELVFTRSGYDTIYHSFWVPYSAYGLTRMRISMRSETVPEACQTFAFGEVEDYTVDLGYCLTKGYSQEHEWIESVQVEKMENISRASEYSDFRAVVFEVEKNKTSTITLTPHFNNEAYTEFWTVWIDYNQDRLFDDPGEKVFSAYGHKEVKGHFIVPETALDGPTGLRVIMRKDGFGTPCSQFQWGEVEDYTVNIQPKKVAEED